MNADVQRVMGTVIDRFNHVKHAHSRMIGTGLKLSEHDALAAEILANAGSVDLVDDLCHD